MTNFEDLLGKTKKVTIPDTSQKSSETIQERKSREEPPIKRDERITNAKPSKSPKE